MTEAKSSTPEPSWTREPQPSPEPGIDAFRDFLAFRKFATPFLVQFVFWGGTIACLVWGLAVIEAADEGWRGTDTTMVWAGLGIIVAGPALLRIAGELIMVVFRIHERLGKGDSGRA